MNQPCPDCHALSAPKARKFDNTFITVLYKLYECIIIVLYINKCIIIFMSVKIGNKGKYTGQERSHPGQVSMPSRGSGWQWSIPTTDYT
jgi:hypothetical protein